MVHQEIQLRGVGKVGYYAAIEGLAEPPLVFVHGIATASSSRELWPLCNAFSDRRRFALDLPGFGTSERGDRPYAPDFYAATLARFIQSVAAPGGTPVDLVAVGLSCEFAARAALKYPSFVRSLALIAPTSMDDRSSDPAFWNAVFEVVERYPVLAEASFRALTSRLSLGLARRSSSSDMRDTGAIRYAHVCARQPDARFAPLAWLRGDLATPRAYDFLYRPLRVKTLVVHGSRAEGMDLLPHLTRENPLIRAAAVDGVRHPLQSPMELEQTLRSFYGPLDGKVRSRPSLAPWAPVAALLAEPQYA